MITKTITGANTKFFVEYANDLIKKYWVRQNYRQYDS